MKIETYRKKPIEVEVMQWTGTELSAAEIEVWSEDKVRLSRETKVYMEDGIKKLRGWFALKIKTLEGTMTAHAGDYIIRGVAGEYYPCKGDIFAKTYEKV